VRGGAAGLPLELGAQWIHGGCPGNTLYNLALARDLLGSRCPQQAAKEDGPSLGMLEMPRGHYLTADGRILGQKAVRKAWDIYVAVAEQMLYFTSGNSDGAEPAEERTMEEFFWRRADRLLEDYSRQPEAAGQLTDVELALSGMSQSLAAYISEELAESGPYMSEELPGGDIPVPGGLDRLAASLAAQLPPDSIRLEETVVSIAWDATGVTATTNTATGQVTSYKTGHIIVTLPLGVLAASPSSLFTPPLDAAKQLAVRNMKSGRLAKVFLEWTRPWWTEGEGSVYLAWSRAEAREAALPAQWTRHIAALTEVEGQPGLLTMWVAGPAAVVVEGLEEANILEAVGRLLRQFTGDPGLEFPARFRFYCLSCLLLKVTSKELHYFLCLWTGCTAIGG
jgi:spermine oxidase